MSLLSFLMDHFNFSEEALQEIQTRSSSEDCFEYLIQAGLVSPKMLCEQLALYFQIPEFDLIPVDPKSIAKEWIIEPILRHHRKIILNVQDHELLVATANPFNQEGLQEIQFQMGLTANLVIVPRDQLSNLIRTLLDQKEIQNLNQDFAIKPEPRSLYENSLPLSLSKNSQHEDGSIISYLNRILYEAIEAGISDVHFEPYGNEYRIRYRKDGFLSIRAKPPLDLAKRIAARLKVMSHLDLTENRLPQDGHFSFMMDESQRIDFRISICPCIFGETIVLRILNQESTKISLEELGFTAPQKNLFLQAMMRPQGMILVTGPTGCGKTLTLYAALNHLNSEQKNIVTIEDPVEIKLSGINQVSINPKINLNFPRVLRAFLRQDPDVMVIGEIRDLETAEAAISAAQTGHLILATLHANSTALTLTRLLNMGIAPFNINEAIHLIIAQRLVRRLCSRCKIRSVEGPNHDGAYRALGCNHCHQGYQGQLALFELMPFTESLIALINQSRPAHELYAKARQEGMMSLYESGLEAIRLGLTSFSEVLRVTQ